MIYWELFREFFMIGALSFGGGYGMISLVRERVLAMDWLSEGEFLSLVGVSESTPGPMAVNMATFVGSTQGGFLGAAAATFGVVLPSFCVILTIAALLKNLLEKPAVSAVLEGIRPCVVALILATGLNLGLTRLLGFAPGTGFAPDVRSIGVLGILLAVHGAVRKLRRRAPSPIAMILLSAALGILFWGVQ